MFKKLCLATTLVATLATTSATFTSCASVPLTGRKQLLLVNDDEVLQSSIASYNQYMAGAIRSGNRVQSARVTAVGQRIAAATEAYLRANGMEHEVQRYAWEFNLIQSDDINAFCMPGGKIVVYEGIMSLAQTDDDLAVVVGHEVAHAVAKHSNERMSQTMLANYGGQVLLGSIGGSAATQAIASQLYGLTTDVGFIKPFGRKHELEADKMGLVLMAMAGYNPEAAVRFWQRMSAATGQQANRSDFFSTHPNDDKRAAQLQKLMPEAIQIYEQYRQNYTTPTKTAAPSTSQKPRTVRIKSKK